MVREHLDRVYNLALRLTGNQADAWDLAQESMIKAVRALPSFRGEAGLGTWLFRITVNAWKNRVESSSFRWWSRLSPLGGGQGLDEDHPRAPEPAAPDPLPDQVLERGEDSEAVHRALGKLDPVERAILVLREIEDRSYEEIATIMGIPVGTVKSRLHRARSALARELEGL